MFFQKVQAEEGRSCLSRLKVEKDKLYGHKLSSYREFLERTAMPRARTRGGLHSESAPCRYGARRSPRTGAEGEKACLHAERRMP